MAFAVAAVERNEETGLLVGIVPGIPGAHTRAATIDELCDNLREVIELLREDEPYTGPEVAVLWREENMVVATCVDIGTVSQGWTAEEALANLQEATELYLEEFGPANGESRHH